jgi:hypothetical protein
VRRNRDLRGLKTGAGSAAGIETLIRCCAKQHYGTDGKPGHLGKVCKTSG